MASVAGIWVSAPAQTLHAESHTLRDRAQDLEHRVRIAGFLSIITPPIRRQIEEVLTALGYDVTENSDFVLSVAAGENRMEFCVQNLFLEIATIDRNE